MGWLVPLGQTGFPGGSHLSGPLGALFIHSGVSVSISTVRSGGPHVTQGHFREKEAALAPILGTVHLPKKPNPCTGSRTGDLLI